MTKKIKLMVLVKSIDGGTGTFLLNLLDIQKVFKKNKIELKTLVLERPTFREVGEYRFDYFRKKDFYPQKYSLSPVNFLNFFKEIFWIRKRVLEFKPKLILSIDLRCNLLAIVSKILFAKEIKVITTNHIDLGNTISDKATRPANFLLKKIVKIFYDRADKMVCVSEELSKNLKKRFSFKKKVITVYNGQNFKPKKPKSFPRKEKKIVITVARLVEQKDHLALVRAFSFLLKSLPATELWIASNGPEKNKIQKVVKTLGIKNKVKFLGWVKDIGFYLKKADIFVLSSKREGFGYVLLEAMSQGLPVISTDTPFGPSEILDKGKYGLLTPRANPDQMRNAMYRLLTQKKSYEYFAKKSIERTTFFSLEKMLKNYKKIILSLC